MIGPYDHQNIAARWLEFAQHARGDSRRLLRIFWNDSYPERDKDKLMTWYRNDRFIQITPKQLFACKSVEDCLELLETEIAIAEVKG